MENIRNNNYINPEVKKMMELNFEGNIIPAQWYKKITYPSGKPNLNAIIILSEIVYWYRPKIERNPYTGEVIGYKQKFNGDKLQRSYQSFADQFGLTKRQVQEAIKYLQKLGLIKVEFRNLKTDKGLTLTNIMFIEPVTEKIKEITYSDLNPVTETTETTEKEDNELYFSQPKNIQQGHTQTSHVRMGDLSHSNVIPPTSVIPPTLECKTSHIKTEDLPHSNVGGPTFERGTYTEITTENTTKITTEIITNNNPPDGGVNSQPSAGAAAEINKQYQKITGRDKLSFFATLLKKYPEERITNAVAYLEKAALQEEINNPEGFLVSTLKNNWDMNSFNHKTQKEFTPPRNYFNSYTQRSYNVEELEKKLLEYSYRKGREERNLPGVVDKSIEELERRLLGYP
ncbi:hypothetical protein [Caldanaerobacter subterraneus]|uniref:DNA replication protein DnaD n=1 Tax=Caldanaerobacter subterraneus TaxID=911092 RepID=A0A4R2JF86_9THEO|nr:hypothetical protein [Caldanaerobacter subterraneus]TCO55508.1 hypothetical protein EV203_13914 [Caldanaerobacter subterraneus]